MKSPRPVLMLAYSLCLLAISSLPAGGTPYWGSEQVEAYLRSLDLPSGVLQAQPIGPEQIDVSYADMLARTASFLRTWQVDVPSSPDDGGIREGEHLPNIIQTDNTSEAIWVWTRYFELTGDDTYHGNITRAFQYSLLHPAYNEEGGGSQTLGYYRMYNCGWAVRAEQKYRDIYGDLAYKAYSDSCANYIRTHTLVRFGNAFYDYVNPPVLSWALGNLYAAGAHEANQAWIDHAVLEARDKVKVWVETEPALLGNQTWAMSGGATMWGILNSYLLAVPDSVTTWVPRYKDYMDASSDPGDFTNAWNGWYALGHRGVGLALADTYQLGLHVSLTNALIAEDGDSDGGIPARPEDTDAMDQTWVSNYLAFMGLSDILAPLSAVGSGTGASQAMLLTSAPNPFRDGTRVSLDLPAATPLDATIFDLAGRRVAVLERGTAPAGRHEFLWDGRGPRGENSPSGVYMLRVNTLEGSAALRIVRLR